jgi:hypothetical protein
MKTAGLFCLLLVLPFFAMGQATDDVKVNNKKVKEKKGMLTNNPEIKRSKKEMAKQGDVYGKKKYQKEVGHKHKKNNEDDKEKKEEKKAL